MKAERQLDGSWLAKGRGPLRKILAEGTTRREAVRAYSVVWYKQDNEHRLMQGAGL